MQARSAAEFDEIYKAHQPPAVRALMDMTDYQARQARGLELAQKGFLIDYPIMVVGIDPFIEMQLRDSFGFTWVPSLLGQPVTVAPGVGATGSLTPYDPNNPPRDAIKVSLNLDDYPPYDPPKPPSAMPVSTSAVGISQGFGWTTGGQIAEFFQAIAPVVLALGLQDGSSYQEPDQPGRPSRGMFILHESPDPFAVGTGQIAYWFTKAPMTKPD